MLVVTTMVLAQMLLRTAWRESVVVALAIPLSVAKNGLRILCSPCWQRVLTGVT